MKLETARKLARVLDRYYVDPLLGLVLPGAGDILTGTVGVYLVALAVKERMPGVVVARMLINLTIDMVIGAVPLVGDLFDLGFRANEKNLALLEKRTDARPRPGDWLTVAGAIVLFLAAITLPVLALVWALRAIF